ncbi:MAG: dihydroorotate dehydrogenase electron transfer subunit [Planctomycetota bacterium]
MTGEAEVADAHALSAGYYADHAAVCQGRVLENVRLARDTYRVRIECRQIAASITPGQFVMIRLPGHSDPLLGRPFALYDTALSPAGEPYALDIVYLVVGKLTGLLSRLDSGDTVELWGPLGNGFSTASTEHLIMVAGGIGQTPFLALGREFLGKRSYGSPPRSVEAASQVTLCYGVRTHEYAAGEQDFRDCGVDVRLSSDDGSVGKPGLATGVLQEVLSACPQGQRKRIVCCGPEPMMEAVARIAAETETPCEVSLETPMACGVGICFSCVTRVRQKDDGWDYKRTCVEGPVFDAATIEW